MDELIKISTVPQIYLNDVKLVDQDSLLAGSLLVDSLLVDSQLEDSLVVDIHLREGIQPVGILAEDIQKVDIPAEDILEEDTPQEGSARGVQRHIQQKMKADPCLCLCHCYYDFHRPLLIKRKVQLQKAVNKRERA